jgi:hypothetical protein
MKAAFTTAAAAAAELGDAEDGYGGIIIVIIGGRV